jgi:hypothetical protein
MTSTERPANPDVASDDSTWSSAPKLSRKVRELAHRSFHALRSDQQAMAPASPSSSEVQEDLRDLQGQVARLQRKIHDRKLEALIPWIDALRQQVDDRLRAVTAGG